MTHTLATNLGERDFHAALFADHATVLQALVFTAEAFVIFDRAKDFGAEKTVSFGLESSVVDGLWLFHFAIGPGTNFFRRSQTNLDLVEHLVLLNLLE